MSNSRSNARFGRHLRRFGIVLAGFSVALAANGFALDKDASYSEMRQLSAQMDALKPQIRTDATAAQDYMTAQTRYGTLSNSLGGDDPARAGSGSLSPTRQPQSVAAAPPVSCGATTATFTQSTPVAIVDQGVVTSTITVSGAATFLYDVNLQTFITHTFPADLDVTITSPAGTVVTLTSDNAGSNDDVFNGTVWDDSADPGGQVPYTADEGLVTDHTYAVGVLASPLVPEEALGAFVGEDPNGTWTLTISDDAAGDGGNLNSWSLILTTFANAPTTTTVPTVTQSTPVAIADVNVVTSTIAVSGAGPTIFDVNATTFITHTFPNDLDITLTSPAGTVVTLTSDNAGSNDDVFNGTVWDDSADPGGQVPYTADEGLVTDHTYAVGVLASPLVPEEALGAFIGEDPNGIWTLTISDDLNGDTGNLGSWSLDIQTFTCAALTAQVSGTKTVVPASAYAPGTNVTYTIALTNSGSGAQPDNPGDEFTDTLPASLTLVSATASSGTATATGDVASWNGTLPAGGSVTITIVATIGATATGTINNQGTISFDSDGNGSNDASASTDDPGVGGATDPTAFTVAAALAPPVPAPALNVWGRLLILLAFGMAGMLILRRRFTR